LTTTAPGPTRQNEDGVKLPNELEKGKSYQYVEGNSDDFKWRSMRDRIEWTDDESEISQKLADYLNLPRPWRFCSEDDASESRVVPDFAHGGCYHITRISKMTLLLDSSVHTLQWETGQWEQKLTEFKTAHDISGEWRLRRDDDEQFEEDNAHGSSNLISN
jgi:hypothetical protein